MTLFKADGNDAWGLEPCAQGGRILIFDHGEGYTSLILDTPEELAEFIGLLQEAGRQAFGEVAGEKDK